MIHPDEGRIEALRALVARLSLDWYPEAAQTLHEAFLRRSWARENASLIDNERLEFLGDAVLTMIATELLLERDPTLREGNASQKRAAIVSRESLDMVGAQLDLGRLLIMGVGEERTGGRRRPSILGCTLEALAGALYLTYPWKDVRTALRRHAIEPAIEQVERQDLRDHKSRLQELCQERGWPLPAYRVLEESGPESEKLFTVAVYVQGEELGRASARRKQLAQRAAAGAAMAKLEERAAGDSAGGTP